MSTQQFVILARGENGSPSLDPLGTRDEVVRELFNLNTGPERTGDDVLFGPGIRIELTPGQDPVTQMLLTVTEEEIGWQVIQRFAARFGWKLLDPTSGREWMP